LVLAGGSNVVVADEGFDGLVLRVRTRGVQRRDEDGCARLSVQAGEDWDALVARAVADGSSRRVPGRHPGLGGRDADPERRCLRPGGGRDDRLGARARPPLRRVVELAPEQCGFGYRTSAFKRAPGEHVVLAVEFVLARAERSAPVRYGELARALGVELGHSARAGAVREAVLGLRRGKGMVLDPADPDSVSAGSFFTNPILEADAFAALEHRAGERPPAFPEPDGRVKTSAAWLVERAGFQRGYGDGRAGISSKHTLALVNRGGATTAELVALAREIAAGVEESFGVALVPEPVFVGHRW
jgi:UDP-N-acetylmuramate dehydrogenase